MQEGRVCTRQVARNARNGSENNVRIRSRRVGKGTETGRGTGSELRGRSMLYMVADSLGPEDISQRSWSRSNPEGCSFSTPRNPSCLRPSATAPRQKLLLYSSFAGTSLQLERDPLSVPSYPGSESSVKGRSLLCTCSTTESVAFPLRRDRALLGLDVCARLSLHSTGSRWEQRFAQIMDHASCAQGCSLRRRGNDRCRSVRAALTCSSLIEFLLYVNEWLLWKIYHLFGL